MTFEERMRELPEKAGVDALVAVSPENFAFVAQTYIMTTRTLPPRQAFAILPREGEPVALDCSIEHAHVDEESWIRTARTYTEFTDHPMDALADALEEIGLRHGRLGIDLQFLSQASYAKLAGRLPGLDIVDTTDVVARARMIKTEDEVARVEFGLKSTHAAAIESMERSRLGESEKVMADRLVTGMIANGADGTMFLIFGTGPRNRLTHALPTDRVPGDSEIIRFDFGGTFGPWMSDVARTNSGGPGKHRGGTGQVMEFTHAEGAPFAIAASMDRVRNPARGRGGGKNGWRGSVRIASGRELRGKGRQPIPPGETLILEMPGGGGFGDPLEREPQRVADDVRDGMVSRQAALSEYGVVLADDGSVHAAATQAERSGRG